MEGDKHIKAVLKFIELLKSCGSNYEDIYNIIQQLPNKKSDK